MGKSKSFTEYVKIKFEDLIWKEIESFIDRTDFESLELKLKQIERINDVEVYDINVRFVNVFDLPKDAIKFDVIAEVELYVYDRYYSRTDLTENVRQWFTIKCVGNLDCNLNNVQAKSTSIYTKSKEERPMSDSLVPIINKTQLEDRALEFTRKYYPEIFKSVDWVDPIIVADRMGLNVVTSRISKDGSVFGQIFFKDTETLIYDPSVDKEVSQRVTRKTVLVDPVVAFQRNLGALNNTIIHECVHWELHQKAFQLERLFNEEAASIRCNVVGDIVGSTNESTKWMEWQANALAPKIQMPLGPFKTKAFELIHKYRRILNTNEQCELMPYVIDELSIFFHVSKLAAKIRLVEAEVEEAMSALLYVDNRYVRPHSFKKGTLKLNQTFAISAQDAAVEVLMNPSLKNLLDKGLYVYIESHFVINHPKYWGINQDGEAQLTDYARYHMDECCLVFDLKLKDNIQKYYATECYLNRSADSPFKFEIKFNADINVEEQAKVLADTLKEGYEVLDQLPNNFCGALKHCLKWRNMSQKELCGDTGISEKTMSNIINGRQAPAFVNVILICLGLHLPPCLSEFLIEKSAHRFQFANEDHIWYKFALQTLYPLPINEIRKNLQYYGVNNI